MCSGILVGPIMRLRGESRTVKLLALTGAAGALALASVLALQATRGPSSEATGRVGSGAMAANVTTMSDATDGLEPGSIELRGTFRNARGRELDVLDGDASPTSQAAAGPFAETDKKPQRCVRTVGEGYASTVCGFAPLFQSSDVLFGESASGGPAPSDRTEYFISGIASARVGRIDAITSDGVALAAKISQANGFFVELTPDQLARGVTVVRLDVYGQNGARIQTIQM